jgi:serine/threonine-protein kinase
MSVITARTLAEDADAGTEALSAALEIVNEDQTLGRYELLAPLGRGGMAMVWAARLRGSRDFATIVAIKTMLPALCADPRFETMFLAEAEIASRIRHPNVCAVLDLGEDRDVLYLVMEWIDGEPVSTILDLARARRLRVPFRVAASIAASAARGLHAAHEPLGVVHRDVSPQNILVGHDGHVKIVDFGVAKAAQRTDRVTHSGYIKGKVAYLAPEQIRSPSIDHRADVFALGVVLYEMTTARHPFRGETELDTLLRIASPEPPPAILDDDYPDQLRAIVERALAKEPSGRYPTMQALARDLEAFVAAYSGPDGMGTPTEMVASFVGSIGGDRRGDRAVLLREAMRAADERAERRRRGETDPAPRSSSPAVVIETAPRRVTTVAVTAAIGGIALGALAVWASLADSMAKTTPAVTVASGGPAPSQPAHMLPPPAASAEPASAPPSTSRAEASASASAVPREAPPRRPPLAPARSLATMAPPTVSTEPSAKPRARFRQPDF